MKRSAALAIALIFLAGCTKVGTQAESGRANAWTQAHVLRYSDAEDIPTLNPHLYSGFALNFMTEMTMGYLFKYDHNNRPVPELATEYPTQANGGISADGKTITFHIRQGVKWSDGAPFDADDVVFSTNVVNNPKNNEVGRDGWDLIEKIDEPDKFTVIYHLKKPYSSFEPSFFGSGGANPCILPKHLLDKYPDINHVPYNQLPVGIGPFKFTEWKRGDYVLLEANTLYWRGRPKLDKVIYKIVPDRNTLVTQLQTGQIDLWPLVARAYFERLQTLKGTTLIHEPGYGFAHLDFNVKHSVVSEIAVRHAIRLATDRPTLKAKVGHNLGILQEGMVSPVAPGYDSKLKDLEAFDLAKANDILDKAGWVRGADGIRSKNGVRLDIDFASSAGTPDTDTQIELMRGWWKQIGINLIRKNYQPAMLFGTLAQGGILNSGKYDVAVYQWYLGPIADLSNLYECSQIPPNGQNSPRWCNKEADAAMEAFKATYDEAKEKEYSDKVQEIIFSEVPTIVLNVSETAYAYNSDLKGFKPNAVSPFDDMMNVDI